MDQELTPGRRRTSTSRGPAASLSRRRRGMHFATDCQRRAQSPRRSSANPKQIPPAYPSILLICFLVLHHS